MPSSHSGSFPVQTTSLKRKLNDPTTSFDRAPNRKAAKIDQKDSPSSILNGRTVEYAPSPIIEDVQEEDEQAAGLELPPDDEEQDLRDNDEEGRFFGGGVSKQQKEVLDYIEENEDDVEEEINLNWLKKTALNFERKINKNAELRAKYEDDPMKFVSSEADLDSEIKGLSLLSGHPELYKDFVKSGCCASLVGLLAHDNTDIAIAAIEVLADLIDEDSEVPVDQWSTITKSMLNSELVDLLVSNLSRLDESIESDSAGVYHVLNVMESLLSDTTNAAKLGEHPKLLEWLVKRIQKTDRNTSNKVGQNRQYAAEILVILAQHGAMTATRLVKLGAVDVLLQTLSIWRKRDPEKDSAEEEFAENLFDCLVALVKDRAGCEQFMQDEGIELCLIMLKEGNFSKSGSLRVLDHASSSQQGAEVCERVVEAGGLKPLFTIFMKSKKIEREMVEHILGILFSLLRLLPAGTAARTRTLAKFVEKNYEKCTRLLQLRKDYTSRISKADVEINREKKEVNEEEADAMESEWLSKRMDAGFFSLQNLNVILAWLIAEDKGARNFIISRLEDDPKGIDSIWQSLREQSDSIEIESSSEATTLKEMLGALLECL